jgi:hypothetical protein
MAFKGEQRIVAPHAVAIVDDADELPSASLNINADAGRAGVERVLKQLFDHRSRAVDHLASRNLVGYLVGENMNAAHRVRLNGLTNEFTTEDTEDTENSVSGSTNSSAEIAASSFGGLLALSSRLCVLCVLCGKCSISLTHTDDTVLHQHDVEVQE